MTRISNLKVGDVYTRNAEAKNVRTYEVLEIDTYRKIPRLTIKELSTGKVSTIATSSDKVILLNE